MAFFSQDFVERVRAASELSQVVGSYNVHLKRAGANMLGLCPFHNEKTPSFNVKTTEQFFRCFGCGAKGDVFRFVQMMEKVEFPEAVKMLAERAGLAPEYDNPAAAREAGRASELKSRLLWCCSRALDYFEECLAGPGGAVAREYLASRGFEKETISRWRIGWAPESWDGLYGYLVKNAKEPGQKEKVLEYALQAGLLRARDGDGRRGLYDAFRGRVMFPIVDAQSRPIAFGGRVLVEKEGVGGKYINSPEGRLFEKRKVLFGLAQAAKEISLTGEAVVVEGYTDVIMCHQYGIRNVVATLGTSLTEDHVGLLRRHVAGKGRVVAFFDDDGAGRKATRRAINLFMEQDVPLAVASDLEMKDAGDFLPKYGADEFRKKLAQCRESFAYVLAETLGRAGSRDPQAVAAAVREALETVNLCPDPITRSLMRRRLAAEAGIPEEALPEPEPPAAARRAGAGAAVPPGYGAAGRKARPPVKAGLAPGTAALDMEEALQSRSGGIRRREAKLLRYMWESPEWCARIMDEYPPDEWRHGALADVAALVRDEWNRDRPPSSAAVQARATNPEVSELLAELVFPDGEPLSEPDIRQILTFLAGENSREELRLLQREMERAEREGDSARAGELLLRRTELRRRMTKKTTTEDATGHLKRR